ncbi:Hypothetical predicted protein, partial [Marmota monax]
MLVNLWGPKKMITFVGCVIQLYVYMWLGSIECLLLAVMSYDRFTAICIIIVLTPLILILISYGYIAKTVLKMKSKAGQCKAMNTCGSHLTVVSIFYGTIIYMYLQPGNSASKDQ